MCGGSSTLLYIGTKEDKASPRINEKNHGIQIRNACTVDYWHCFIVSFHGKHGFSIQKVMHLSPPSTNPDTNTGTAHDQNFVVLGHLTLLVDFCDKLVEFT